MAKRKGYQIKSEILNDITYLDYYQRLKELTINSIGWRNLPPTVDERFLELTLFELGYCVYFQDEIVGDLALTCTIGGRLDVYRIPMYRKAYSVNGYQKSLTNKDSVLIFNNALHTPTEMTIRMYALRMYQLERAIDVNVNSQKTPVIVEASEQQRLTMKNMALKYDGNEPFIFANDKITDQPMKVLNTQAPFVADKLQVVKNQVWNEALTFIGIENSNQDKKERLVADEVGSNYGNVEAERNVRLIARKQASDAINRMFGTNIEPYFRSGLNTNVNVATLRGVLDESFLENDNFDQDNRIGKEGGIDE